MGISYWMILITAICLKGKELVTVSNNILDRVKICDANQFSCLPSSGCISLNSSCDGIKDCPNGEDEEIELCSNYTCAKGLFTCGRSTSPRCIEDKYKCDGDKNCLHAEDEEMELCSNYDCPHGQFTCYNSTSKRCIDGDSVCDDYTHCPLGEDEEIELCSNYECPDGQFTCYKSTSQRCIPAAFICDGMQLCHQGEDEEIHLCSNYTCPNGKFTCHRSTSKRCIYNSFVCDGDKYCPQGEDEEIGLCASYVCPNGKFKCYRSNSQECIYDHVLCDGYNHCPEGEDEELELCSNYKCPSDRFNCYRSFPTRCLSDGAKCSHHENCPDFEDEENCSLKICGPNKFNCYRSDKMCIEDVQVCDGARDCAKGEDEEHCHGTITPCHLLNKLLEQNIPWNLVPDWMCIANAASRFTPNITSHGYGIFQITTDWCQPGGRCHINCTDLQNENIEDDIECIKVIYREQGENFMAFPEWQQNCTFRTDLAVFGNSCLPLPGEIPPAIITSFQDRNVEFNNGQQNELTCTAIGYPLPYLSFIYNDHELPITKPEFNDSERPAKQVSIKTSLKYLLEKSTINTIRCIAQNHLGRNSSDFHITIKGVKAFPYEIVVPIALIFFFVVISLSVFLSRKYIKSVRWDDVSGLTDKEVEEFIRGNPERFNTGDFTQEKTECQPYDEKFEIDREKLHIQRNVILGQGEYGCVYKGKLESDSGLIDIALKTAKSGEQLRNLLSELKLMIYIGNHPNVILLHGACTKAIQKGTVYIVMEFCRQGSLEKLLRDKLVFQNADETNQNSTVCLEVVESLDPTRVGDSSKRQITNSQLGNWAWQIATGMNYIQSKGVIHSDLATRNILITCNHNVKITDFGLSRRLYGNTDYVKTSKDPLPWRWMSIEALRTNNFSTQSDVWSFGVTLWEMYSMGAVPYPGLSWDINFPEKLMQGLRLPSPDGVSSKTYDKMLECWNLDPHNRPTFQNLADFFIPPEMKCNYISTV